MLPTILGILFSLLIVALLAYCLLIATLFVARVLTEPTNVLCKCTARLDGKLVIVTGGNSGIGFQTAKDLANRGAKVIIADVNNSDASVKNIIEATGNEKVEYRHLDLADFKSVRTFAEDINKTVDRLDILVNNAGILTENNYITKDGAAITMQVNYLGPFLLTSLLMDKLTSTKSRIVIVASEVGTL
ncbi:retinol dehydrogenase 11-like [Colias croceus]|uniref:retinol dehydrogenase 11-like n=1 Tax=Colias crocea TaxID=72248 RepID=UPI001E27E671|nr:retinol dehydrogenase 11-like [Colias croceus]